MSGMESILEQAQRDGAARPSLRLGGQERAVEACRTLDLVTSHRAGPAFEADIVSTWRDSQGQDATLSSGIVMELKRENGTMVQTISGQLPDGAPLDISYDFGGEGKSGLPRMQTNLKLDQSGAAPSRMRLRLRTEINRRVVPLRYGDSALTLTLETGRVFAWPEDGRFLSQRVGQAELVLDDGKIGDLHGLAIALAEATGLGPVIRSPEQIGRALLQEDLGGPVKAPRYDLPEGATAADVLDMALEASAIQIFGNIAPARLGDTDGIKQLRIGLRRLRSILTLFRKHVPEDQRDALIAEAKRAAAVLGEARDLDVFVEETLPAILSTGLPGESERDGLEALGRQADLLRQADKRAAMRLVDEDAGFAGFCVRLQVALASAPWRANDRLQKPARTFARKALGKALTRVEARGRTLADAPPHSRHPLRVELKKLRYALHAFRPLYASDDRKPYLSALSHLQDEFGALNDAVVAREMVLRVAQSDLGAEDRLQIEAGAGYVTGWTQRGLTGQADRVLGAWQDFEALSPFWQEQA